MKITHLPYEKPRIEFNQKFFLKDLPCGAYFTTGVYDNPKYWFKKINQEEYISLPEMNSFPLDSAVKDVNVLFKGFTHENHP